MNSAFLGALPSLNALLNATSAVLLVSGWLLIRRRRMRAHELCMLAAFVTSIAFLASYLVLRYFAGVTAFTALALIVLFRAFRAEFARHRRLARWTLPLWLYVSVTGVVVYDALPALPCRMTGNAARRRQRTCDAPNPARQASGLLRA